MERRMWARVAEATRPLHADTLDGGRALAAVLQAVEEGRGAGLDSAEMRRVRGLALDALQGGSHAQLSAVARIHGAALVERARLGS
jgi:hypothetical protein